MKVAFFARKYNEAEKALNVESVEVHASGALIITHTSGNVMTLAPGTWVDVFVTVEDEGNPDELAVV